jgi:DNA repair photolyase
MSESPKGRGSNLNPPNRFGGPYHVPDLEQVENDEEYLASLGRPPTEYIPDKTRSVVSQNDSPDVGFRYSVNPYRGCSHGCAYCYARPTHEYLGLNAGLDFETKILVKHEAPDLLREFLSRDDWKPDSIALSGVTDPYQPAERQFRITRGCIEVALEARQPLNIITKNALVVRDLALFQELARRNLVHVNISVTTLNADLARTMEPRTSVPEARLRAVSDLARAGVPVRVLVAPIIPGLNDSEIPMILRAAKDAGAADAGYILLRLPWTVRPVFLEWLARTHPTQRDCIEGRIRAVREGKLNEPHFGDRMTGKGEIAERIRDLFHVFQKKYGIDRDLPPYNSEDFRAPLPRSGQGRLF